MALVIQGMHLYQREKVSIAACRRRYNQAISALGAP